MWLAVLFVVGSCLPPVASEGCSEASEDTSSWVRLKPLGHCRDGESTCPYRITFPQLTIQLPKPFRELEKMAREMQSLTQIVNQLKADCRECKERQRMQWNLRTTDGGEDGERIQASRGTVNTKERQQDLHKRDKVAHGNNKKTEEEDRVLVNSGTRQVTLKGSWDRSSNPSNAGHRHENSGGPKGSNPIHSKVRGPHLPLTEENGKKLQYPSVIVTESSFTGKQGEVQTTQASSYTVDTREREDRHDDAPRGVNVPVLKSTEEDDPMPFISGTKQLDPADCEDQMWSTGQDNNSKTSTTGHKDGQNSERPKGPNPAHPKKVITTGIETQRWTSSWDRNSNPSSTGHKDENSGEPEGSTPTQSKQVTTTGMENHRWNSRWDRNSNPSIIGHKDKSNGGPNGSNPTHMDMKTKNMSKVKEPHLPFTDEKDKDQHSERVILTESSWHLGRETSPKSGHKGETTGGPRESNPAHMGRRPDSMSKVTESLSFSAKESDKELQSPTADLPISQDEEQTTTVSSDNVNTREIQQEVPPRRVQGTTKKTEEDTMLISSAPKKTGGMKKQKWNTNQERNPTSSRIGQRVETSGGLREASPTHIGRSPGNLSKVTESQSFLSEENNKEPQSPRVKLGKTALSRNQNISSDTIITRGGEQDIPQRGVQGTTQKTKETTVPTSNGRKEPSQTGIQKQRWNPRQDRNFNRTQRIEHTHETSGVLKEPNPVHVARTTENPNKVGGQQSQEEEHTGHGENHKANTSNVWQEKNPSGTLTAEGKIESIPETSIVPVVLVDDHTDTKKLNPPTQEKPIKRFPGFPRLINTNRTASQGTPNTGNRLETRSDPAKRFSPTGNTTVKYFTRGSGLNPVRLRPKEEMPHKAESKEGTGIGDADMPDVFINGPEIIYNPNVLGEKQPVSGTKATNTKTVSAQQSDYISDFRTRVKEPIPSLVDETSDSVVANVGTTNMVQYEVSENNDKNEKKYYRGESLTESKPSNQGTDLDPDVDARPIYTIETVDGTEMLNVPISDLQTQDSQSKTSSTPGKNAESGMPMDSVNQVKTTSGPADQISDKVRHPNPRIQDRNSKNPFRSSIHEDGNTGIHSKPLNTAGTGLVDARGTYPQRLDHKDDLLKEQIKPDHNTTTQGIGEIQILNPIKEETETQNVLRDNKALKNGPVKQTSTARTREEKIPERSASRPDASVDSKVKVRPRPANPVLIRTDKLNPHSRNSTKIQGGAKELSPPNLRMVKNVTRSIPNHLKQPERTASGRVIQTMSPKQRKPYILHIKPENRSSEPVEDTSRVKEHMVDITNARRREGHPKAGPTSSSPNQEINSTAHDMTQSVRPTVALHNSVAQVHLEQAKTAPTVEAINSLNTHQIRNTLQNTKTKLFHVPEPGNPGGKRELDPVTDGVKEHSVETEKTQNILNLGSKNQSRPDSNQAVVEKIKGTDTQKGTNPLPGTSADSNQENNKKPIAGGSKQNSRGEILTTVDKVSTQRNSRGRKLNYTTTAATYTIKPAIMDKQSQMLQTTAPVVTTPTFKTEDHAEKAKSTSGASNTHVHYRLENPTQGVESKRLTGTMYDSDSRNKEQDPTRLSTDRKVGGSTKLTMSHLNSIDNVPNRATDSNPFVMDKNINITGPKWSTPSTDSMPHTPAIPIGSVLGNNGEMNGNSYPVAVNRVGDTKMIRERISIEPTTASAMKDNTESPLTFNNLKDRDGQENQLLSTCHDHCNPSPTAQPDINIQRSSENDKDKASQDCSDLIKKNPSNGVYSVTPAGSKKTSFRVFCDMEVSSGGWTVIQHRFDGNLSFNRTWDDYKRGFGNLTGEFWLGNDKIHWLTSTRAMVLRIELEDLDGVKEYAQYNRFKVANESQHYRLTIGGYSGTAGNAMQFSKKFNHDQKNFTTPDRDNDRYPSGNCGAYYSSGWWFDACMSANLNGKYYETKYKGVRNGIFWGTWHNISTEYYPTNDRQSFKTVRMMVRPRMATGRDF